MGHIAANCRAKWVDHVDEEGEEELGNADEIGWGIIGGVHLVEERTMDNPAAKKKHKYWWDNENCDHELGCIGNIFKAEEGEEALEPSWSEKLEKGRKIKMIMDSGAVKTIVPQATIPGMVVKETEHTGKYFRAANGGNIPNKGETRIKGKSINGGKMNITAQVAEVTKPLAAANEVVDAELSHNMENWIILNKRGGAITTVSAEARRKIQKILKDDAKPMVPIKRENN